MTLKSISSYVSIISWSVLKTFGGWYILPQIDVIARMTSMHSENNANITAIKQK